ncbi:MAG TPA: alkaline phosphatase D family protein [Cyclobacteriaceae bacterium]|nr:alkaline phosphatase D family protein [Cyclobacteriaceae bacterium]
MKLTTGLLLLILGTAHAQTSTSLTRIAFGSCSRDELKQMWPDVVAQKPQLWIWGGDNIYGDSHDANVLRKKYDAQKREPGYQMLLKTCPVIGTWDDHDYGVNDGGKYFSKKEESKAELLRFLDVPASDPVRSHPGVYTSYTYGTGKQKIKVLLLDTRAFRDTLVSSATKGKRYDPNPTGDVLGEAQWKWLEQELKYSDAAIHLIVSSIQFLSAEHGFECWGNFPIARQRMIDLIRATKPNLTLILSGDRHIAEFSKMSIPDLPYPLYDFTSSGLTHTVSKEVRDFAEPNPYRVGKRVAEKNFGLLIIDWSGKRPRVTMEIRGENNARWEAPIVVE